MSDNSRAAIVHATIAFLSLVMASAAVACGPAGVSTTEPTQEPAAVQPDVSVEEMAEWVAFRRTFGLRTDEAWLRLVAADLTAGREPVPLLQSEIVEMQQKIADGQALQPAIDAYGRGVPDSWAGSFVAEGQVIALFSRDADVHRVALRAILGPEAAFDVRRARSSLLELEDRSRRINADAAWLASIDASLLSVETYIADNAVQLRYQGPSDLEEVISAHYAGDGWLSVVHAAPNPWTGAVGTLVIVVTDASGAPVSKVYCDIGSEDPRVGSGKDWQPEYGTWETDGVGRCLIGTVPAVSYRINIRARDDETWVELATARVTVLEEGTTTTAVTVPRPQP